MSTHILCTIPHPLKLNEHIFRTNKRKYYFLQKAANLVAKKWLKVEKYIFNISELFRISIKPSCYWVLRDFTGVWGTLPLP